MTKNYYFNYSVESVRSFLPMFIRFEGVDLSDDDAYNEAIKRVSEKWPNRKITVYKPKTTKNMFKVIVGDLVRDAHNYNVIAHGCNCFNTMGAGIALGIKNKFPEAYKRDCCTVKGAIEKLGSLSVCKRVEEPQYIANLYSQFGMGINSAGQPPIDYEALEAALEKLKINCRNKSLGLPLIGFGLAGGDLITILDIYKLVLSDLPDVTVVIWEGEKNAQELRDNVDDYLNLHLE